MVATPSHQPREAACDVAKDQLHNTKQELTSHHLPRESPRHIFPTDGIRSAINDSTVRGIFCCTCDHCYKFSATSARNDSRRYTLTNERAEELLGEFLEIFALLVKLGYAGLISKFVEYGINLNRPLRKSDLKFLFDLTDRFGERTASTLRHQILEDQYEFCVRRIESGSWIRTLGKEEAFPIFKEQRVGNGDYGEVFRFEIYNGYTGGGFAPNTQYARKVFKQDRFAAAIREDGILALVRGLRKDRHDHLTTSLASFKYGETFFIVLPFASATLHSCFADDSSMFTTQELWEQICGLLGALEYLHGHEDAEFRVVLHLDLKPSNILVVGRRLQLSDFGLSKFKELSAMSESGSRVTNSTGFMTYAPPEHNIPSDEPSGTRYHDVYSMGGIISEVASFDVGGRKGLKAYRDRRRNEVDEEADFQSLSFHLSSGQIKHAVCEQHQDILRMTETGVWARGSRDDNGWRARFYDKGVFSLLEDVMLATAPEDRKSAGHAANMLRHQLKDAQTLLPSSQDLPDIWHDVQNRNLDGSAEADLVLRGTIQVDNAENRCGLCLKVLHQDTLQINSWVYGSPNGRQLGHTEYRVNRQNKRYQLVPLYALEAQPEVFKVKILDPNSNPYTLSFLSLIETHHFQTLFTGRHVLPMDRSFELSLCKMENKRPKLHLRHASITCQRARLQIWCDRDLSLESGGQPLSYIPKAQLAIITAEQLILIKVANNFEISNTPNQSRGPSFQGARTAEVHIECKRKSEDQDIHWQTLGLERNGIPAAISEPEKSYRSHFANFHFAHANDIPIFCQTLAQLQHLYTRGMRERNTRVAI